MTLLASDPLTPISFSIYENKGVFAILIGSGLSRAADIPTGWEITLDLIRRVATAQGVEGQADWAKWYRDTTGQEPNYSGLLEELSSSPEERRSILHGYIEPSEEEREQGKKVPTAAHRAIAGLVFSGYIRVIITTNFDRLMENALREKGVEPTVVSAEDALNGAEPLTHSQCYLLKLHGDYKDARILNTDSELSDYPESYNRLLDRIFDEHGLIVCGWSGEWDHALRAALMRAPNRRYSVYWALRGNPGDGAKALIAQRRAKEIPITGADEFLNALHQRIETLQHTHRQNPLSVDLLVSSTKRFLSKPEFRIQLDELATQEVDRLVAHLEGAPLPPHTPWSAQEFNSRVSTYEAATEPLSRMVSVLGRWGDGSEFPLILDIIRTVFRHGDAVQNGLVVWLGLRTYPAVLLFTAYGLGLVRAERWKTLHELFFATILREDRDPNRIVSTLFLWSWKGTENDVWKHCQGVENRKTPLSDHLLEVMTEWRKSFVGIESNFELLFERFEVLGSLAYFEEYQESYLEERYAASQTSRDRLEWMPVGRSGWNGTTRRTLLQDLENESNAQTLLRAGFAKNSHRFLQLFIENLKRFAGRMGW